jgi:excinuclease ABC subunit A
VLLVDQSSLGRTPRSNPAVYVGAFDFVRATWADSPAARASSLGEGAFSFNSAQGRCERCGGAGHEKIEMQFLSDVYVRCPACHGRRYQEHVLAVKVESRDGRSWSIGDLLDATVEEAVSFLKSIRGSRPAARASDQLCHLLDVGLGYLRCGQPVNTLSGGECQRLKLASHLAEWSGAAGKAAGRPTLFVFDEPTTGLHFEDVRVLMSVFHRLVDDGHSVLVVEHNMEVIRQADWVIDLGPGAGADGGRLVSSGTPEAVAANPASLTGRYLAAELGGDGRPRA